jgi:hypothetical protein
MPQRPSLPTLHGELATIPDLSPGGGGVATITMDMVINYDNGTGGLTATKLNNGTHGAIGGGTWTTPEGAPATTNIEDHDVEMPFSFRTGGVNYNGSSGQGMTFDFATEPVAADVFHYGLATPETSIQIMYLARFETVLDGVDPVSYNNDTFVIAGANFTVPQYQHTFADVKLFTCHSDGDLGASIPWENQWLLISVFHDVAAQHGRLLVQEVVQSGDDWILGDILGSSTSNHTDPAGDTIYIRLQSYLRPASGTGTIKMKIAGLRSSVLDWPPYSPGTIPTPTSVAATQTGFPEVTLSWTNVMDIFRIERKVGAGSYSTLVAEYENNGTDSYIDSAVSNGNIYTYRVTALIGGLESGSAESNSVTVSAFTPAAGNVLWLKADALSLANNDPVTTWTDSSGNGNDVTQAVAGAKPTYKTNILNGLPVVRGDGGDYLARAVVTTSNQATIMIVLKKSGTNSTIPFYNGNTAANGYGFFQGSGGTRDVLFGGSVDKSDGTPSATDFEVWTHTWNGSVSDFWVNGAVEFLTDPSTSPNDIPSGETLVMGLNGSNQWNGDIAEVLFWDNVLTTQNREIAEDYLGGKYGITITH